MEALYKEIGRAAATPWNVLVTGATGTGKELVARAIHQYSDRASGPFIPVNCCAIPEPLFESEVFGHEAGAFTGARARRMGCFEQAHGGTVFLDELGDLSLGAQVKLLRVLQEKRLRRLGGDKDIAIDVRVIAATNRNLSRMMETNQFREDLFHRVGVCMLRTPELREHTVDVEALVNHLLLCVAAELRCGRPTVETEGLTFLRAQAWPGNVRQLENVIRRAALNTRGRTISLECLREAYGREPTSARMRTDHCRYADLLERAQSGDVRGLLRIALEEAKANLFRETFAFTGGNITKASDLLGVGRTTLRQNLRELGLLHPEESAPVNQLAVRGDSVSPSSGRDSQPHAALPALP